MTPKTPATNNPKPPRGRSKQAGQRLRVAGIAHACRAIQAQMRSLLPPHPRSQARVCELSQEIRRQALRIEQQLERRGASPADLTRPSRQAYLWLVRLSSPALLEGHMEALVLLSERANLAASRKRMLPVQASLSNTAALYRARQFPDHIELVVHEGFCEAPAEVIEALVQIVFVRSSPARRKLLREFAASEAFTRLARDLSARPEPPGNPQGRCYNLEEVFQRVNAVYFEGRLERPRIAWSRKLTTRKMGHYESASDTVMVSRTLDDPSVPLILVDFIMYHELLHKKLGVKVIGVRRYGHTPEFRKAEKAFLQYAQAQAFLQAVAEKHPTARRVRTHPC